jgi:hypothetical protein
MSKSLMAAGSRSTWPTPEATVVEAVVGCFISLPLQHADG